MLFQKKSCHQKGQVMLLTVIVLSAVFLSVTALAGFLMTYQLRQVTNVIDGSKAIFAADAALERGLFVVYRCNGLSGTPVVPAGGWDDLTNFCNALRSESADDPSLAQFLNGATYKLLIDPGDGDHDGFAGIDTVNVIKGGGRAGRVARALGAFF